MIRWLPFKTAGPHSVQGMLRNPGKLAVVSDALLKSFAFDSAGASLLLYVPAPSSYSPKVSPPKVNADKNNPL